MKLQGSTRTKVVLIVLLGATVCVAAGGLAMNYSAFSLMRPGGVLGCMVADATVDAIDDVIDAGLPDIPEVPEPPAVPEAPGVPEPPTAPASPATTDWALGDFEVDASRVSAIELNWLAGEANVRVVPDEETGGTIRATETRGKRSPRMQWDLSSNGVLTINYMDGMRGLNGLAGCSNAFVDSKELELLIPDSLQADLQRFELELASGECFIDGANGGELCSTLELGVASGSVYVSEACVNDLNVSLASGRVSFGGTAVQALNIDQASGEFTFGGCSSAPERIAGTLASGRVVLELPADTALAAKVDKMSGNFRNDFEGAQSASGSSCDLDLEILSGNVDVLAA